MALGDLVIKLGADIAQFQSDLGRAAHIAQQQANAINRAFSGARNVLVGVGAAVSVAGIINSFKAVIDAADQAKKSAEKFGTTTESISSLAYAGKQAGVDMAALDAAMTKLSDKMADAAGGGKQSAAVFKSMGIEVQASNGKLKASDELLREVADKFAGYKDGAAKAALATELFGKSGTAMIPMLNNLRAAEEEAKRLGVIFSGDMAKSAAEFNDNLTRLNATFTATKIVILNDVLPWLSRMLEQLREGKQIAGGFFEAIRLFGSSNITSGNAGAKVKELRDEIDKIEKKQKDGKASIAEVLDVEDLKKKLEFAKSLQRRAALDTLPSGLRDEGRKFTKRDAPIVPKDLAGAEAAARAKQKQLDEAAKIELATIKDAAQRRDALLDASHKDLLVGEKEYWIQKLEIQKTAVDAELKVLDDQIKRQQDHLKKQTTGSKEYYDALGNLQESQAKRNKLELDFKQSAAVIYIEAERAARQYQRQVEELNNQLLELQGRSPEAALRRFQESNRELRAKAFIAGDIGTYEKIGQIGRATEAQAEFNKNREEQNNLSQRLAISEERIQNSLRTGAISELEALRRTGAARAAAAAELEGFIRKNEQIARDDTLPKWMRERLALETDQARAALERLKSASDLVSQKFEGIFTSSFASAFADFASGAKSASEAFKDFANSVVQQLSRMYAEATAKNIWNVLNGKGAAGGDAGGGAGGLFGGFMKLIGLDGGSSSPGPIGGSDFAADASLLPGLSGSFATGTDYVPQTGIYQLHKGEAVVPASENGRGGVTIVVQATDAASFNNRLAQRDTRRLIRSIVGERNPRTRV